MARKILFFSFLFLLTSSGLIFPIASSATPITDFDGFYNGTITVTLTTTLPTDPPEIISKTETNSVTFTVHKGGILDWGEGAILNKAGDATMTVPITGYSGITFTAKFSRNTSTGVTTVTGDLSGSFPSAGIVISGRFKASGGDKFSFKIPSRLGNARIGQKYPGYSFCQPPVAAGRLCGIFKESNSPTGGKPPYTFRLKMGSDFFPTGMTLNSRTGQISGTPKAGQKPTQKRLVVCAYDSNNLFTGVCRTTTMLLTR